MILGVRCGLAANVCLWVQFCSICIQRAFCLFFVVVLFALLDMLLLQQHEYMQRNAVAFVRLRVQLWPLVRRPRRGLVGTGMVNCGRFQVTIQKIGVRLCAQDVRFWIALFWALLAWLSNGNINTMWELEILDIRSRNWMGNPTLVIHRVLSNFDRWAVVLLCVVSRTPTLTEITLLSYDPRSFCSQEAFFPCMSGVWIWFFIPISH